MAVGWRGQYQRYREFFLDIVTLYRQRADLRAFFEIILSISTITIFLVFALKPTALTIISLVNDINEKRATLTGLTQKVNDLQTADNVFNQNQNQVTLVDSAVATQAMPDLVAKQVVGLSAKDFVTLLGFGSGDVNLIGKVTQVKTSPDLTPLPNGASEMSISINAKGDYINLLTFIKDLENLRIPIKIDSIGINSSKTDSGQVIVAAITGRVPYLGNK